MLLVVDHLQEENVGKQFHKTLLHLLTVSLSCPVNSLEMRKVHTLPHLHVPLVRKQVLEHAVLEINPF